MTNILDNKTEADRCASRWDSGWWSLLRAHVHFCTIFDESEKMQVYVRTYSVFFFKIIEGKRVHIQCVKAENLKVIICEFN